jgi:rod shape-determining protein MreC
VIIVHDTRRSRVVFAVLLVAALGLITANYSDGSSAVLGGIKRVSGSVFGGAENVVSAVTDPVARFFGSGGGAAGGTRVRALQQQVIRLRAALSQAQLSRADYRQLSRLLQLSGRGRYKIVAASVIAFGQGYQQTVTLDAGSADGVRPQQTVLDGQGLVGDVTSVTAHTATVLLATDASSVVGVRLAPHGDIGWVTGQGKTMTGPGLLKLRVLNAGAALTPGEQLVTSASVRDRPFVPGVPVGVISKIVSGGGGLTPLALVRPYTDFAALSVVGVVIRPPRRNPHFAVLPPRPAPRPTPTVTVTVTPGASPAPTASPGTGG